MKPWEYQDWMGWHEQGDGKLFLGINIEQGRVRDIGSVKIRSALRAIVDEYDLTMILTPLQSVIFKDIDPSLKETLNNVLKKYGILQIEEVEPIVRKAIACPALPLCGLATTEAERRMPEWNKKTQAALDKLGLGEETLITRMTGCPNGCARPYMAELALVGDGADTYQLWVGGSPALTKLAKPIASKVKWADIDNTMEGLFKSWRDNRNGKESFGDYCARVEEQDLVTSFSSK